MKSTRDRILDAAVRVVRRQGVDALTVRSIAESLEVTPMAVYKHFDDKADLIAAVIQRGFAEWEAYLARAVRLAHPRAVVWETAIQYREFALAEPRLFELMFLTARENVPHVDQGTSTTESPSFNSVAKAIATLSAQGTLPGNHRDAVLSVWATMHGLLAMNASGRFGKDRVAFRIEYERILGLVFPGLSPNP
jgi:AcrR family transcriptional regulator